MINQDPIKFSNFSLHPQLQKNIEGMGFTEPTPIQLEAIPVALDGKDLSGLARTGTGKTASFLIPSIHRLTTLPDDSLILCLAPTRELAQQIQVEASKLSANMNMGTVCIVGGLSAEDQIDALKKGARIIVGTPGRIIDLYKEGAINLARVEMLVFDEADRMFDMGFIKDMDYLLRKINPKRQILLYSATLNFSVLNMIYEFGSTPHEINVSHDQVTAEGIRQAIYQVGDDEKPKMLLAMVNKYAVDNGTVIVFVNYKEKATMVADILTANGVPARALSSLMHQDKRNIIIKGFRGGKFRALVATDVASRGLDIEDVSLVVNYHLPEDPSTYVHRIGRTARAGKTGIAVSLASSEDAYNQLRLEEYLGNKIPPEWINEQEIPQNIVMPPRERSERPMRGDRPQRGERPAPRDRAERGPRPERAARPERAPRPERGPRPERAAHERTERPRRGERPQFKAPEGMPSPVAGNPVIYCTKTGKAKNRSDAEVSSMMKEYEGLLAAHAKKAKAGTDILKKIGSKVTSLFGKK